MEVQEIPKIIHPSWYKYIAPLLNLPEILTLKYNILPHIKFAPVPENIFRVFSMPMDDIKVIFLGQD